MNVTLPPHLNILIADDHRLVRDALIALLSSEPDMGPVHQAENGLEAVQLARQLRPDLVIMDLVMPQLSGVEATRRIHQNQADTRILVLTMLEDIGQIREVIQAGAAGVMVKSSGEEELFKAIKIILSGKTYLSSYVSELLKGYAGSASVRPVKETGGSRLALTPREQQILKLVLEEHTTKEMADILGLTPGTINVYRSNLLRKTGVRNTAGLISYALTRNLLT